MLGDFQTYSEYYEWEAIDLFGNKAKYTTNFRDITESELLEHLKVHYPNLRITSIRRMNLREVTPPHEGTEVNRHAYSRHTIDDFHRKVLGKPLPDDFQTLMRRAQSIRNQTIENDSKLRAKRETFIRQNIRDLSRNIRVPGSLSTN